MKCLELWGTDCDLELDNDTNYQCKVFTHSKGSNANIINSAIAAGYSPEEIAGFISNSTTSVPSDDFIEFVLNQPGGIQLVATSRHTPQAVLASLVKYENKNVLLALAKNTNTPPQLLDDLADSNNLEIRVAVAANPKCPAKTLAVLSLERHYEIKQSLAGNISTPQTILAEYAKNDDKVLRNRLVRNDALTPELLQQLALDTNFEVRVQVAKHSNASEEILIALANDPDWRVRYAVAQSPNVTSMHLEQLAKDEKASVRSAVAISPFAPHEVLDQLLYEEDYVIRYRLAQNPALPLRLFVQLLHDENTTVRRILTTNSATPFFYTEDEMNDLAAQDSQYAWTALLSLAEAPESVKNEIRKNARQQAGIAINRFASSHHQNLKLLADLVSGGIGHCENEVMFDLLTFLCKHPQDSDRINELVSTILSTTNQALAARARVREIILREFTGPPHVAHAILRRSQAA